MLKIYTMKWVLAAVLFFSLLGTGFAQIGALEVSAPANVAGTYAYISLPACWGSVPNGVCGDLLLAQDTSTTIASACADFSNAAEMAGKIAVVDRGVCGFSLKALNAQNAGAIAVIVVNNANPAPAALGDAGQGPMITIPVVMLSQADGNILKAEMASSTVTACLTAPTVDVTFTVNMSTQTVSPDGVHIAGNFQDWDPSTTAMTDNGDGTWSYTASFFPEEKLQYKFINGITWDNAENVFAACSVDGNRTYCVGTASEAIEAVCFNACGSCDPISVTFSVDMSTQTVSANGVHIAGNFQGWDPAATAMTDNGDGTYSYTGDFLAGQDLEYKFINGNAWGTCGVDQECLDIAASCTNGSNDNRHYVVTATVILATPCYNSCDACPVDLCSDPATLICDNFDLYTVGSSTTGAAPWWSVWPGSGQPGIISDLQSNSPSNSMLIPEGGAQDVLLLLGDKASGNYKLSWKMYITPNKTGYYNIQDTEATGVYNGDVFFGTDATGVTATFGQGVCSAYFGGATFTYPEGAWFDVVHNVDLDNDHITFSVNGTIVYDGAFAGNLGAIDFYSINADNNYFVDDVEFRELAPQVCNPAAVICDGFESYNAGTSTTGQAPWWDVWVPGTSEGGLITTDQVAAGNNSMNITNTGLQDVILKLGNLSSGNWELSWKAYISADAVGYWNMQETEIPGTAWNSEVSFGTDNVGGTSTPGVGIVRTNNVNYTFDYPSDTWIDCIQRIDLDNNTASYWINGVEVINTTYAGNMGGIDFYSINTSNNYYVDEVQLISLPPNPVLRAVTLEVDFTNEIANGATISANGVHLAGDLQSEAGFPGDWDPSTTEMTLVSGNVYGVTLQLPDGTYQYKFVNGNAWGDCNVAQECLTAGDPCGPGNNDNRQIVVSGNITSRYCYSECVACDQVIATNNPAFDAAFSMQPNPANNRTAIVYNLNNTSDISLRITNNVGQLLHQANLSNVQNGTYNLNLDNFASGVYFVYLSDGTNYASRKLVVTK